MAAGNPETAVVSVHRRRAPAHHCAEVDAACVVAVTDAAAFASYGFLIHEEGAHP